MIRYQYFHPGYRYVIQYCHPGYRYVVSIWEMTLSILSSWISIWDILSLGWQILLFTDGKDIIQLKKQGSKCVLMTWGEILARPYLRCRSSKQQSEM